MTPTNNDQNTPDAPDTTASATSPVSPAHHTAPTTSSVDGSSMMGTINPPVLSKAVASATCGILSIPSCFCTGIPSILLGVTAIMLGYWVRKNFRDTTASEAANVGSWIGTISGSIGIVLGIIAVIIWLVSGAGIGLSMLNQ